MYEKHFEKLLELIAVEREAEKAENRRELDRYPLAVREALGKTVTRLVIQAEDVGVGGMPLLMLTRTSVLTGGLSPFHAMNQGDNVLLTYPSSSGLKPVDGTLYDVDEFHCTVAINGKVPDPLPSGACQLDMLGSDATYKRMKQALGQTMRTGRPGLKRMRDVILGEDEPTESKIEKINFVNERLNEYQQKAVQSCLRADDVAVVHGPPGTGKTTVLVEVIIQSVKAGKRVLASAPSNIAVDNMVEKLIRYPHIRVVRLGHPARILEPLRHVTLSAQEQDHPASREVMEMDDERHRLIVQMKRKKERTRGRESASQERADMKREIDRLWKTARDQEYAVRREIVQTAQVVLATHGGLPGLVAKQKFDLVVLDEASQATEPLSWIPLTLGSKAVFAGDNHQLPPTIYSHDAAKNGLSITLFDQLKETLPERLQTLLRIQYRMNEPIMGFSSSEFYEGKLIADKSVKNHRASGLPSVNSSSLTDAALCFIDTAGTGYEEMWNELLESRENEGEAQLVSKVFDQLRNQGIRPGDMALLSPYVGQVKRLRLMIKEKGLEIGSIDSFQGREKEVVILSLVRSNDQGEVGFLKDVRRMNVGMTRARRLLVVIGDSATIGRYEFYTRFLEYVEKQNAHHSAWEWMDS